MSWISEFCGGNTRWADTSQFQGLSLTGQTPCFEAVALAGSVHLVFLVLLPIRLYQLCKTKPVPFPVVPSAVHWIKVLGCGVNALIPILFINGLILTEDWAPFELVSAPLSSLSWILALAAVLTERYRFRPPGRWITLFLFLFAAAADAVRVRTAYLMAEARPDLSYFFILFVIAFAFVVLLVLLSYFAQPDDFKTAQKIRALGADFDEVADAVRTRDTLPLMDGAGGALVAAEEEDSEFVPNPETSANIFSRLTFTWLSPLIDAGYKAPLQLSQIWEIAPRWRASAVGPAFEKAWLSEVDSAQKKGKNPSLVRTFRKTIGPYFASAAFFLLIQSVAQYLPPVLLREMIKFVQTRNGHSEDEEGYMLALGIFICLMVMTLCENQYFDRVIKSGIWVRSGLVTSIYRQSLRMSNKARQSRSVGAITNHMTSDTEKVQMQVLMLHNIWSAPIRIIIGMWLLFDSPLQAAVLAGVALVILIIPLQVKIMTHMANLIKKNFKESDARIKVVNEILSGMQVIKYYAWERSFLKKQDGIRERELGWLKKIAITRGFMLLFIGLNPVALAVGTFGAFALANGTLDASTAFFALSLFNLLFWPILLLPRTLSMILETMVSVRRLEAFLGCETLTSRNALADDPNVPKGTVMVKGSYFWESQPTLKDLDLTFPAGKLIAVIGHTGSGKSSLLSAILREMDTTGGSSGVKGEMAYVAQQAWIYNATVQNNITFNRKLDPVKYQETVEVACLLPDFNQFGVARDQTEIGEKGINLSGGQKQRISVARAVYADADVYLFDDPLSALDARVGAQLFNGCIKEYLAGKTRILVTNQLQFLPQVDYVVVLNEGEVVEEGTYHDLVDANGKLTQLMSDMGGVSDSEGEDEAENKADAGEGEGAGASAGAGEAEAGEPAAKLPAGASKKEIQEAKTAGKLVTKEHRETGSLGWEVYRGYIRAAGGFKFFAAVMGFYLLAESSRVGSSYWLGVWSADELELGVSTYMAVYFVLSLVQVIMAAGSNITGAYGSVRASRVLHENMVASLLRAPMSFFNATPIGRIINRFTKDVSSMDKELMFAVSLMMSGTMQLAGTIVTIAIVSPYAIVTFVPVMLVFYFVQRLFRASSRELKRLDSVSRSPVYAHFTETLDGMPTIRAFHGAQDRMTASNAARLDKNQSVFLTHMCANRWLSVRLEFLGGIMIMAAAVFAVLSNEAGNLVGLSLSYALTITVQLNMMVRMSTETENAFNSIERIQEYSTLEQEKPEIISENRPPPNWPQQGKIEFRNVHMRYRKGLPTVLNGINLVIEAGQKIGVAGRTGAGKSSLFQSLFRIAELEEGSSILFDGLDIATIGLKDLRSSIAIIPQNPVLYSGTIRSNLDPFGDAEDTAVWDALRRAQLHKIVSEHSQKLEMPVTDGGENFSVGQRQLLCLARALLRKSRILVVDEATANVDMETDALIQETIRDQFKGITTLTIAHRLNTIIDSDKILILGMGKVLEYDSPKALLSNPDSEFSQMVAETGHHNEAFLRSVVLDESALQEMIDQRAALAVKADVSTQDNVFAGKLATRVAKAVDVVTEAVTARHAPHWVRELEQQDISQDVWLTHLYQLLHDLEEATHSAMVEDNFDLDLLSDTIVHAHNRMDLPTATASAMIS